MSMTPIETKVYDAMKKAGLTEPGKAKKMDDIVKLAGGAKGQVSSAVASLQQKGYLALGGESRANAYYVKK